jgi:hypothetical protein
MTSKRSTKRKPSRTAKERATWRELVRKAFSSAEDHTLALSQLYALFEWHPKAKANPHWKAKLRQTVQLDPALERLARGIWWMKQD